MRKMKALLVTTIAAACLAQPPNIPDPYGPGVQNWAKLPEGTNLGRGLGDLDRFTPEHLGSGTLRRQYLRGQDRRSDPRIRPVWQIREELRLRHVRVPTRDLCR
jgi:hypothetical protein